MLEELQQPEKQQQGYKRRRSKHEKWRRRKNLKVDVLLVRDCCGDMKAADNSSLSSSPSLIITPATTIVYMKGGRNERVNSSSIDGGYFCNIENDGHNQELLSTISTTKFAQESLYQAGFAEQTASEMDEVMTWWINHPRPSTTSKQRTSMPCNSLLDRNNTPDAFSAVVATGAAATTAGSPLYRIPYNDSFDTSISPFEQRKIGDGGQHKNGRDSIFRNHDDDVNGVPTSMEHAKIDKEAVFLVNNDEGSVPDLIFSTSDLSSCNNSTNSTTSTSSDKNLFFSSLNQELLWDVTESSSTNTADHNEKQTVADNVSAQKDSLECSAINHNYNFWENSTTHMLSDFSKYTPTNNNVYFSFSDRSMETQQHNEHSLATIVNNHSLLDERNGVSSPFAVISSQVEFQQGATRICSKIQDVADNITALTEEPATSFFRGKTRSKLESFFRGKNRSKIEPIDDLLTDCSILPKLLDDLSKRKPMKHIREDKDNFDFWENSTNQVLGEFSKCKSMNKNILCKMGERQIKSHIWEKDVQKSDLTKVPLSTLHCRSGCTFSMEEVQHSNTAMAQHEEVLRICYQTRDMAEQIALLEETSDANYENYGEQTVSTLCTDINCNVDVDPQKLMSEFDWKERLEFFVWRCCKQMELFFFANLLNVMSPDMVWLIGRMQQSQIVSFFLCGGSRRGKRLQQVVLALILLKMGFLVATFLISHHGQKSHCLTTTACYVSFFQHDYYDSPIHYARLGGNDLNALSRHCYYYPQLFPIHEELGNYDSFL